MNRGLAYYLMQKLTSMDYVGTFAGLVMKHDQIDQVTNALGTPVNVTTSYPIASEYVVNDECVFDGSYINASPDSGKPGVLYFEDYGVTALGRRGAYNQFSSSLRLVCWLRTDLLDAYTPETMAAIEMDILSRLQTTNPVNMGSYLATSVKLSRIPILDMTVFSRYNFKNDIHQYLMKPYAVTAMDLTVTFSMLLDCTPTITKKDSACPSY